jgi:hypothetical protein
LGRDDLAAALIDLLSLPDWREPEPDEEDDAPDGALASVAPPLTGETP